VITHQKPDQSDLLYHSKLPAKKVGIDSHFQASWALHPMGCLLLVLQYIILICTVWFSFWFIF